MAQIALDLENNHTGRQPTMAIRLGFLIDIFSYNYLLKLFIGIPIQILIIIFVSHAHTELGVPVLSFRINVNTFTGADLDSLPTYGKRSNRLHVNTREFFFCAFQFFSF